MDNDASLKAMKNDFLAQMEPLLLTVVWKLGFSDWIELLSQIVVSNFDSAPQPELILLIEMLIDQVLLVSGLSQMGFGAAWHSSGERVCEGLSSQNHGGDDVAP